MYKRGCDAGGSPAGRLCVASARRRALANAGRTPEQLAAEFEPSAQTIRNWVDQAAADEGAARGERVAALTTAEREELARLRRENRQLKAERDILGKAAAWFARETRTIPSASSGS